MLVLLGSLIRFASPGESGDAGSECSAECGGCNTLSCSVWSVYTFKFTTTQWKCSLSSVQPDV